jgi:hypothetical protein
MSQEMLIPAARYLRMSTERQQYSFLNQAELMAKFAERHGFCVIKTYEDQAKTGCHPQASIRVLPEEPVFQVGTENG